MKNIIGLILLLCMLLFVGCEKNVGDVTTEDTGVAMIVDTAGLPVPNASVRVFKYRDSTGIYVDSINTDEKGNYSFTHKLQAGRYTIWAETDSTVLYREDLIITDDSLFQDTDTLQPARKIWVPVKVQPNHNPQTVEAQIWGTPIRHNVTADGHLILDKIMVGSYFTRLTTTLDGYTPTNDTIEIKATSPDTLLDTLELIYTGIPVVTGLNYTYDTLNTTVNLSWDQTAFQDIQAYVIERKLKSETVWPTTPLQLIYVSQTSHPVSFRDVVSVGSLGAVYQYRIKIIDNSSISGVPFGVLEVDAPPASNAKTVITSSSMQKAKAIVGNRASINDIMSFTVNFSNPSRKLTKVDWYEGTTLLKTTPLTDAITSDSFEKSWPTVGSKSLTVQVTDDAGKIWEHSIPVSIVEDKPVISFVDTTVNLNVLDTLTAVVSDEFGEIVSYQWDWGNDGTIDATTPQFVMTNDEIVGGKACKLTVIDDDGNVGEFVSGVTSRLVWEKVGELPEGFSTLHFVYTTNNVIAYLKSTGQLYFAMDGVEKWQNNTVPFSNMSSFIFFKGYYFVLENVYIQGSGEVSVIWKSKDLNNWTKAFTGPSHYAEGMGYEEYVLFTKGDSLYTNSLEKNVEDYNEWGSIYVSVDGTSWEKTDSKYFPVHPMALAATYSVFFDSHFIHMGLGKIQEYDYKFDVEKEIEIENHRLIGVVKNGIFISNSSIIQYYDSKKKKLSQINSNMVFDSRYNTVVEHKNSYYMFCSDGVFVLK